MEKEFGYDVFFYDSQLDFLLKERNKKTVLSYLKQRHMREIEYSVDWEDKKVELLMWLGVLAYQCLTGEQMEGIFAKRQLQYVNDIKQATSLEHLQQVELEVFDVYLRDVLYEAESTETYSLNRVLKFIHMNLDRQLSLMIISEEVGLSKSHISKLFKSQLNLTTMDYVHQRKIERAKLLLNGTPLSILEVSQQLGYYDSSHFTRIFKKVEGMSPKDFRKC